AAGPWQPVSPSRPAPSSWAGPAGPSTEKAGVATADGSNNSPKSLPLRAAPVGGTDVSDEGRAAAGRGWRGGVDPLGQLLAQGKRVVNADFHGAKTPHTLGHSSPGFPGKSRWKCEVFSVRQGLAGLPHPPDPTEAFWEAGVRSTQESTAF